MAAAHSFSDNRRRATRMPLALRGRCLLSDGAELSCETIDVSVTGVALRAYITPRIGERVVVYLDGFGRLEGAVTRRGPGWFALNIKSTQSKLDRVARKLSQITGAESELVEPATTPSPARLTELRTEFGQVFNVYVLNETASEARLLATFHLLPGARITLDGRAAVVVRQTTGGFVVAF